MNSKIIKFECQVFELLVKYSMGMEPGEAVTTESILKLKKIINPYYSSLMNGWNFRHRITSLAGLEHAVNLREIGISYHQIVDISVLSNLKELRVIELRGNQITDIRPLANLNKLKSLAIKYNPIKRMFLYKENKTQIPYYGILKKMKIHNFISDRHMDDFLSIVYKPTKNIAKEALMKTPSMLLVAENILSKDEISEVITEKLSDNKIDESYVKRIYEEGIFSGGNGFNIDTKRISKKAKVILMELKLGK